MRKAYFQMHIAILLWGLTGIFGKAIQMNEVMIVWYRMFLSALALIIIMYFRKQVKFPDFKSIIKISLGPIYSHL